MYADIAAPRATCSMFLLLTVNDVMFPPVVVYRNLESVSDLSYSAGAGVLVLSVGKGSRDRASQFSWASPLR